jgi:monoamine oxidase
MDFVPVAIVGGGLSGLAAARTLACHGVRSVILEAAPELGGRVRTLRPPSSKLPIELGAEFVHGDPRPLLALVEAHGIELDELHERHTVKTRGKLHEEADFWGHFSSLIAGAKNSAPSVSAEGFLDANALTERDGSLARLVVEGFHAAPMHDVSAVALARDASAAGSMRQFRVRRGYDQLVSALVQECAPEWVTIERGARVRRVEWSKGAVTLSGEQNGQSFECVARRCLVSVSLGVLAAPALEGIEFSPALRDRSAALAGLGMAHVTKLVLTFARAAFPLPLEDGMFLHDPNTTFTTFWARSAEDELQITAWTGAEKASALAGIKSETLAERACSELAPLLEQPQGLVEAALREVHHFDFTSDPLTRGAYSYVRPSGLDAAAELAKPVEDALFFCGEALSPGHAATTAGAIGSGQHAARAILSAMNHP